MPRPGPRPYECVRRAWHSDRHQPMRGSIISQIFRVVTEAHAAATRKNREWQEKLPIVVIKAEEIMYSKANSEDEYTDPDTLWDRLNDAIDTIIRKEEEAESGEYLQPCIEAALVLGCVPVRASRSQRLSSPKTYLHHHHVREPVTRDHAPSEQQPVNERQTLHCGTIAPSNQMCVARPTVGGIQSNIVPTLDTRTSQSITHISGDVMPSCTAEPNPSLRMGSFRDIRPLYYGSDSHNLDPQRHIHLQHSQNVGNVIIGTPIGWSSSQLPHYRPTRELFPNMGGPFALDRNFEGDRADSNAAANLTDCDLSLRLGRNSDSPNTERFNQYEYEAGGSQNPRSHFFPTQIPDDPFEPHSSRWASEGEVPDVGSSLRKRKMPFLHDNDDVSFRQQRDCRPNKYNSEVRWPGL